MNISSLVENLGANIVYISPDSHTVSFTDVIAGDLMADLLLTQKEGCLLVTGLATEQSIRTADMLGSVAILLVNEKLPTIAMKQLAESLQIPLLASPLPMFEACVEVNKLLRFYRDI